MSGQSIFESEADPRIKWALDLMSEDGIESTSVIGHFAYPAVSTGLMYFARSARNYQLRRPLSTGLPLTVALLAASWFAGSFYITQIAINQHLNSFSNLKFHYFKLNVKIKKEAFWFICWELSDPQHSYKLVLVKSQAFCRQHATGLSSFWIDLFFWSQAPTPVTSWVARRRRRWPSWSTTSDSTRNDSSNLKRKNTATNASSSSGAEPAKQLQQ